MIPIIFESLGVGSIGKSGFPNRTRNPKTDFTSEKSVRRVDFFLRNPNPDFMDFLFTFRLGNPKKDLQNCSREQRSFFFFAHYAYAARPLFLETVFQILFRISQSNGKNENPKTDLSVWKSVFGFRVRLEIRNPDFEI